MSEMNAWGIYSRGIPGCKLTGLGFVGGRLGVCAVGATGGPQRVTRGTGWVLSLEPLHWGVGGGPDTHSVGVCGQRSTQLTDMAQPPRVSRGRPSRAGYVPYGSPLSWVRGQPQLRVGRVELSGPGLAAPAPLARWSLRFRVRPGQEGRRKCS